MKPMRTLADRVRRGDSVAFPFAALLQAGTVVARAGMWRRLRQTRVPVEARVVSVGNLTAGGTGKTPAVIAHAQAALDAGERVAVLTRGYGVKTGGRTFVVTPKNTEPRPWLGDEPELVLRRVPGVILVRDANRVRGARTAIEQHGVTLCILDDGFQYVRLERDKDEVLIDAANPFGNGHIIPRGILREPLTALRRATHLTLTRCDMAQNLDDLEAQLRRLCPETPIRKTWHAPTGLWRIADGMEMPIETLATTEINASCAIGHPEAFFATLQRLGAHIAGRRAFADHADIPPESLARNSLTVVTEKDAVRMTNPPHNVWALRIDLRDWTS